MSQALAPCPSCSRHVQTSETTCPFCKNALPTLTAIPGATRRLTRAAAYAFTASIAVAGCSSGVALPGGDGGTTEEGPNDSGGTPRDSGVKKDSGVIIRDDGGSQPPYGVPAYGGPAFDSGAGD